MRKATKLRLILLPVSVVMLIFFVSVAEARGGSFVLGPMQGAVENVALGVSDQVFGNLSVINGCINFFITNPNGVTVQEFHNISSTSFNFTASENGTYSIHLNNTYQTFNVTVDLDYGIGKTIVSQVGLNVGTSSGVAQVVAPIPPTRPLTPDDENEPPDNPVQQYLNFLKASDILNTVTGARTVLPIRNLTLISGIASVSGLTIVISMRERRPDSYDRVELVVGQPLD